jgi:uncharacterized damage-inducible protein DinB
MTKDLNQIALDTLKGRITRIIPRQISECVDQLNDEQLWWRPNEEANSVGNLVLHLSGSIRHYLSREIAGVQFRRDRAGEFAERGPLPKQDLLAIWDQAVQEVTGALDGFDSSRLLQATSEPEYVPTIFDLIYNVSIHMATHAGQIVWVTKMLQEGKIDELWIRVHKEELARG